MSIDFLSTLVALWAQSEEFYLKIKALIYTVVDILEGGGGYSSHWLHCRIILVLISDLLVGTRNALRTEEFTACESLYWHP
jgi:hypothetical protein